MNNKKSAIPLLLTAIIGIFILFLAWAGRQASTGGTDVTDSDYYSKGLKYNSTLVEKRAASVIGWRLDARLDAGRLVLSLADKDGAPVVDANGRIEFPEPGSNRSEVYPLEENQPGTYQLLLPKGLGREQLVRVDFERNGARINRQLLLNIPAPSTSGPND